MLSTNWQGYRVATWVGQFILALAVVIEMTQGNWKGVMALAAFLVASFAFALRDEQMPTIFNFLFVLAALLNAVGWVGQLFDTPSLYVAINHAFTNFSITLTVSFLLYNSIMATFYNQRLLYILTIACFGIAVGAVWEILEWFVQVDSSLNDTIIDLLMDSVAAFVAALVSLRALIERSLAVTREVKRPFALGRR